MNESKQPKRKTKKKRVKAEPIAKMGRDAKCSV
jgi:hypothetical protein